MAKRNAKLEMWQERLAQSRQSYETLRAQMDERERYYLGDDSIWPMIEEDDVKHTPHLRNICAELIEAQVSSDIPQPKVTALDEEDEELAKLIEDMIRNELDRMPTEEINDLADRTVPVQGGTYYHGVWDSEKCTHTTCGEFDLNMRHPKQVIPQEGVYTGVDDMDYIIMAIPTTKSYIKRTYGVDVSDEAESDPDAKTALDSETAEGMVTLYYGIEHGETFDAYLWVNDTEIKDLPDYQARKTRKCKKCGAMEPVDVVEAEPLMPDGTALFETAPMAEGEEPDTEVKLNYHPAGHRCKYCGGTEFVETAEEYEEIREPIQLRDGTVIPVQTTKTVIDDTGNAVQVTGPTRIPQYKPDIYPIVLQKNVSVFGQLLGDSDIEKIKSQQNTTNRIEAKICEKLITNGSYISLPPDCKIQVSSKEGKQIRLRNAADKAMIGVYDMEGTIAQDIEYLEQVYQEARQIIGVTDSFQGRKDPTATSGKAKEFAAAQSAGRLQSKRTMKEAAYARIFEMIFKFMLAYADEPRTVVAYDDHGDKKYEQFNRYDFLKQDAAGEYYWNDRFIFACDANTPLASNREAMWQENRMNLQTGAYGDPADPQSLITFWSRMEQLHYPGAGEVKEDMERRQKQAQMQQMQMMQMQAITAARENAMRDAQAMGSQRPQQQELDPAVVQAVEARAREDAMRDAGVNR